MGGSEIRVGPSNRFQIYCTLTPEPAEKKTDKSRRKPANKKRNVVPSRRLRSKNRFNFSKEHREKGWRRRCSRFPPARLICILRALSQRLPAPSIARSAAVAAVAAVEANVKAARSSSKSLIA